MPTPLDLWLTAAIGFLGSFGHCVSMCGPVTAAFALSVAGKADLDQADGREADWQRQLGFHLLLNLGRLLSYVLVGAAIGSLGSVLFAGGQMAGVGSVLRRGVSVLTGVLLIWFGLSQASPGWVPSLPLLHPARQQRIHEQINQAMAQISSRQQALTPVLLGLLWGLIPCGFLYTGQLRAAATQSWLGGAAVMLAFGLGTVPAMVAMGVTTSLLSQDRRSQLFRLGGWVTILIGMLLLVRTGDTMSDVSGHAALLCLMAALVARPIAHWWAGPLRYRRALGVGAFGLSLLHVLHMVSHTWNWNWQAVQFMLRSHQVGVWLGAIALLLMFPAAITSFNRTQKALGSRWRKIHLLGVPALYLTAVHVVLVGSHYLGALALTWRNYASVSSLLLGVFAVFFVRSRGLSYAASHSVASTVSTLFAKHHAPSTASDNNIDQNNTAQNNTAQNNTTQTVDSPPDADECCQPNLSDAKPPSS
ncbi:MAG: sulfite exporter TauE/SafE family protein [Cyanobacteria bacterium J06627_28]